jgi:hypothetical protein
MFKVIFLLDLTWIVRSEKERQDETQFITKIDGFG